MPWKAAKDEKEGKGGWGRQKIFSLIRIGRHRRRLVEIESKMAAVHVTFRFHQRK
jgi:hypothetical protein